MHWKRPHMEPENHWVVEREMVFQGPFFRRAAEEAAPENR